MKNLEINDVFPLVDVPDNSVYIFFLILFISILFTALIFRFLYRKLKTNKNKRKYIKILKNRDFKNAKDSSYKITYYARLLVTTDKEKELLDEILKDISLHKYEKNVPEITDDIKESLTFLLNTIENNHV